MHTIYTHRDGRTPHIFVQSALCTVSILTDLQPGARGDGAIAIQVTIESLAQYTPWEHD